MISKKLFLLFFLFFHNLSAFCVPDKDIDKTNIITNCILNCQFDTALKLTDSLIIAEPQNPLSPVLKLATLGMRDVDLEMNVDTSQFISTYLLSMDRITAYENTYGVSSYSRTILGFTKVIHSTFYLRRKMYMAALQNGLDALKIMREAKRLDATNTDVDFFLGLYDYAKAELHSRLWWVLFWYPGGKKEGIQKLTLCSKSACITKNAALLSLLNIYITEKDTQALKSS